MLQGINTSVGLQLAADNHQSNFLNEEEFAEKYGHVVNPPSLRDRIFLRTGLLFIETGKKLTTTSLKHMRLTEEMS
jgi:hypothetical protein